MSAIGKISGQCPSSRATGRDSGFTLFEMMVALAILALISGIGFPRLQLLMARQTMTEARGAVALAVVRARSAAVRRDLPARVTLSDRGDAFMISGLGATPLPPTPLPRGAEIDWPRAGLVIFGDGSSNGATGSVRAGSSTSGFSIDPAAARLTFAS